MHFDLTNRIIGIIRVLERISIEGKFRGNGQLMQLTLIEVKNSQLGPSEMCLSD